MRSKTHEPVLFERSEFTGECAELLTESRVLCTAARRCGCRAGTARLLFFCRRFLFQIKRKCRNAESVYHLIISRTRRQRAQILQLHFVPLARHRCVESPHPTTAWSVCPIFLQASRADDIHLAYFERSETNPSVLTEGRIDINSVRKLQLLICPEEMCQSLVLSFKMSR